jgi:hypothetical protein
MAQSLTLEAGKYWVRCADCNSLLEASIEDRRDETTRIGVIEIIVTPHDCEAVWDDDEDWDDEEYSRDDKPT